MKLADAGSYNPLAETFDQFTTLCGTPLASQLIALAGVEPSQRLLDVGTGTGLVAVQAASKVGPDGQVLGVDLSEGMLEVARAKAARGGLTERLDFRLMDAEALALDDRTFDVVVSLYALFHFPNPLLALEEMHRVLRPRGRIVIAVGSGAPLLSWCGFVHALRCLPEFWLSFQGRRLTAPGFLNALVEKHFPSSPRAEVPEWVSQTRHKKRHVRNLMREAGFRNLRTSWMGHQVSFEDPQEFWELQVTFSSLARKRLARVPAESVAALRREFLEACAKVQARGGKLAYPSGAFYVKGEKA
jgi:ubiquinone/menaquinone biosynthesis C-methylase UbiE